MLVAQSVGLNAESKVCEQARPAGEGQIHSCQTVSSCPRSLLPFKTYPSASIAPPRLQVQWDAADLLPDRL